LTWKNGPRKYAMLSDQDRRLFSHHFTPSGELRRLRFDLGLSLARLARLLGVSGQTARHWEVDETRAIPDPKTAERLAFLAEIRDLGVAALGIEGFRRFSKSQRALFGSRALEDLEGWRDDLRALLAGIELSGPDRAEPADPPELIESVSAASLRGSPNSRARARQEERP
jgi:transcriptional regulator with XRE-family HTH domain